MIKADVDSLKSLNSQLTKQLDQYVLRFNEIFKMRDTLASSWDEEKFGSFANAMDRIKGAKYDVESGVIEIRDLIAEMIEIVEEYNRTKFR